MGHSLKHKSTMEQAAQKSVEIEEIGVRWSLSKKVGGSK